MDSATECLSAADRASLIEVADASIRCGLRNGRSFTVRASEYSPSLQRLGASFVTLKIEQQLRGCIGTLEAVCPLVEDVAEHAFAAAFRDPRFPPLRAMEYPELDIHISVLSSPQALRFASEQQLLAGLQPGIDGLIIRYRDQRATFLPSVWNELPQPGEFLAHLKQKAGLPYDFWSDEIRAWRYTTESFP